MCCPEIERVDQRREAVGVVRQGEIRGHVRRATRPRLVPGDDSELVGQGGELWPPRTEIHRAGRARARAAALRRRARRRSQARSPEGPPRPQPTRRTGPERRSAPRNALPPGASAVRHVRRLKYDAGASGCATTVPRCVGVVGDELMEAPDEVPFGQRSGGTAACARSRATRIEHDVPGHTPGLGPEPTTTEHPAWATGRPPCRAKSSGASTTTSTAAWTADRAAR